MKRLNLLTDEPLFEISQKRNDALGFKTYAKTLARAAADTAGPFTIGIFGEWGTGKTSLLRMIEHELTDTPSKDKVIITVWFNAWLYENEVTPILPLVTTIIRELDKNKGKHDKLEDKLQSLRNALKAIAYGLKIKGPILEFSSKDAIEREEELSEDPLDDIGTYQTALEKLAAASQNSEAKIVVLIDDLDRCFPDNAIKLLESIKLVLAQRGFVFFLGVARTVIEGYLQYRYQKEYGIADFEGRLYLDKIVQLPFHIPPHKARIQGLSKQVLQGVVEDSQLEQMLNIVNATAKSNPRALIRFVNNLMIDKEINRLLVAENSMDAIIPIGYFAITRGLQQRWPELFTQLNNSERTRKTVAEWAGEDLNAISSDELPEAERAILQSLRVDTDLSTILLSGVGVQWLQDNASRQSAVSFLDIQQPVEPIDEAIVKRSDQETTTKDILKTMQTSDYSGTVELPQETETGGEYANFDIFIDPQNEDERYSIAARSIQGETSELIYRVLDEDKIKLRYFSSEFISDPNEATHLGQIIYQFLFPPEVMTLFMRSQEAVRYRNMAGLRVRISIGGNASDLAWIPWELAYDGQNFLSLNTNTTFVRYIPTNRPPTSSNAPEPIRILVASNLHSTTIDGREVIKSALSNLVEIRKVKLSVIDEVTSRKLRTEIRRNDPHILHFIGNATTKSPGNSGLIFQGENGQSEVLDVNRVSNLLRGQNTKLVILNGWDDPSTTTPAGMILLDLASQLLRDDIPAVISTSQPMTDAALSTFLQEVYERIAFGDPIDEALSKARIALFFDHSDANYWASTALFLRSPDGNIW